MADSEIDNGGPAYPVCVEGGSNNGECPQFEEGMSLRDYFAGQALPAVIAATSAGQHRPDVKDSDIGIEFAIARDAYAMADAMIRARKAGAQ